MHMLDELFTCDIRQKIPWDNKYMLEPIIRESFKRLPFIIILGLPFGGWRKRPCTTAVELLPRGRQVLEWL